LIINALGIGALRFTELHTAVEGISTQNLRVLERDGVVNRNVSPTVPPRVDYSLTEAGLCPRTTVCGIWEWTRERPDDIDKARHRLDAR
jgi:DNA-binding HxlR family transcriptional regulator